MTGDDGRRQALFNGHMGRAESLARRYRGRGVDEDDLGQEALLALWESALAFSADADPAGFWVYARPNVEGRINRLLGRESAQQIAGISLDEAGPVAAPDESGRSAEAADDAEAVRHAMRSLPTRQRRHLSDFMGLDGRPPLTMAEIADREGIPVGRVQRSLDAAREMVGSIIVDRGLGGEAPAQTRESPRSA